VSLQYALARELTEALRNVFHSARRCFWGVPLSNIAIQHFLPRFRVVYGFVFALSNMV